MDNRNERRTIKPVEFEDVQEIQPEVEQPHSRRIKAQEAPESQGETAAKPRNVGQMRPRRRVPAVQQQSEQGETQRIRAVKVPRNVEEQRPRRRRPAADTPETHKTPKTPAQTQRIKAVEAPQDAPAQTQRIKAVRAPQEAPTQTQRMRPVKRRRNVKTTGNTQRIRTYPPDARPTQEYATDLAKNLGKRVLRAVAMTLVGVILVVVMGLWVYDFAYSNFVEPMSDDPTEVVEVVIDKNDSLNTISEKLEAAGVIRNSTIFKYYVDFSDMSSKLLAGKFTLSPSMTYDDIINVLKRPAAAQTSTRVMLVEGILNKEMVTKLEDESVFENATDFNDAIVTGEEYIEYWFVQEVIDKQETQSEKRDYVLEGYLFPDTYDFFIAADEESVIEKMLNRFNEIYTDEYKARAEQLGMTTDEVVTLASIIQKEAGKVEDFAKVSAVFHNRLNDGMALQSCATLQYFMTEKKFVYTAAETRTPSPYNTYIHTGLPIGPICNPGKDAIEAALWPSEEYMEAGYFYFCAGDPAQGTTVFAKTLEEHNANVAKYEHLW